MTVNDLRDLENACDRQGTVLFPGDGSGEPGLLFADPVEIITVTRANALEALAAIDESIRADRPGAGYFSYELNEVFDGIESRGGGVLGRWGVYREVRREPDPARAPLGEARVLAAHPEWSRDAYRARFEAGHEFILSGATYQVNLTFRLDLEAEGSPADLFAHLRRRQPTPFASFQSWPDLSILSFSPELFFRLAGGRLVMKPMKGTSRRGGTPDEDARLGVELAGDAKNRAENVMIVDLVRNDLGRIGRDVRVDSLCDTEGYPTLWQMTSTVSCRPRADLSLSETLRALFPSGSVTGAPKISTMKIIRELESSPRGVYCGAIGYALGSDDWIFSVPIRTLVCDESGWSMRVGSGVTVASDADAEYDECLLKARFLSDAALLPEKY